MRVSNWKRFRGLGYVMVVAAALASISPRRAGADVYNWQTNQAIPGTQGIVPGPNVDLANLSLEYASLSNIDLTNGFFRESDLSNADFTNSNLSSGFFSFANLTNANLTGTNLTQTDLFCNLTNANFTNATLYATYFEGSTGFTFGQLASTASYKQKSLTYVNLDGCNMAGGDFSGQYLNEVNFESAILTNANFANADALGVNFSVANVTGCNFTGSNVSGADFSSASLSGSVFTNAILATTDFSGATGVTFSQIASSTSFQQKNLGGIGLHKIDLSGWDLSGQNLSGSDFSSATLTNTNFANATVVGTYFSNAVGFTFGQLASTAGFQQKNLTGIQLAGLDMSGWDFSGQDLTRGSNFQSATLTNADFTNSNLNNAVLSLAAVNGANFTNASIVSANFAEDVGLTFAQIASTASFAQKNLSDIVLSSDNLSGWNLSGQNLIGSLLNSVTITGTNFAGCNLIQADFYPGFAANSGANFHDADLRGSYAWVPDSSMNTTNTIGPDGTVQGLSLAAGERLNISNYRVAITIDSNANFDPASTLQFSLEQNWGSLIQFGPGVTPELGGTLDLEIDDGLAPSGLLGEPIQLFEWNSPLDPNDRFDDVTTAPGLVWDLSQLYSTGTVTLVAVPEPGLGTLLFIGLVGLFSRRRTTFSRFGGKRFRCFGRT